MSAEILWSQMLGSTAYWTAAVRARESEREDRLFINSITLTSPLTEKWVQLQADSGAPWIGTLDDPEGFLAARGWKATLTPLGAPEANYDRWPYPVIPATMPGMPRLWFVTGEKERPEN